MIQPKRNVLNFCTIIWVILSFCGQNSFTNTTTNPGETNVDSKSEKLSKNINSILKHYDKAFRPDNKDNSSAPLSVNVSIDILNFGQMNSQSMKYTLLMNLELTWFDMRLADSNHNHKITESINLSGERGQIWVPDIYFPKSVDSKFHHLTQPNSLIWFDPDGRVTYMKKLTVSLSCSMDFSRYPMDNQMCPVDIGSYGYKRKDLALHWRYGNERPGKNVEIKQLQLNELTILKYETGHELTCGHVNNELRPCIQVKFYFRRNVQYYLMRTYLPNILVVIISWLSFLIDFTVAPARVTLGLIAVLTIITQTNLVYQAMPKISYIKAIDVWLFTCLSFVIIALLEFAFVNSLCREGTKPILSIQEKIKSGLSILMRKKKKKDENIELSPEIEPLNEIIIQEEKQKRKWLRFQKSTGYKVDGLFFVMFPLLFIIFNIIYWTVFLSLEE